MHEGEKNPGLQGKRMNSLPWFCYECSWEQQTHHHYKCVVWDPSSQSIVPFLMSRFIFHIVISGTCSWFSILQWVSSCSVVCCFLLSVTSWTRHVGSKYPLCNIELKICTQHLGNSSPQILSISAQTPSTSCACRTSKWLNTCCNSFGTNGGISWIPPEKRLHSILPAMAPHAHHLIAHYSQNMYKLLGNWFGIYLFLKYAMFLHYAVQTVNFSLFACISWCMFALVLTHLLAQAGVSYHDVLLTSVGRCWKHGRSHGETFALNWFNLGVCGPILFHNNLNNSMPQIHHILGTLLQAQFVKNYSTRLQIHSGFLWFPALVQLWSRFPFAFHFRH